ncbi:hypothetical protein OG806_49840 [Streptomyces sp. NBC_00882]|uniref:hypothetical protein n=1 Tax=Streptomyces sp. NBC_00882 TaxID=2975856 RepID=UPI00386B2431|nr:hypothetical protein OG806_00105 [Streptomyces sp. NBC_00882]WSZ36920.1 hypothetical protein OG806_49840 [Streptomyces sp. NBC_00882]
MGKIVDLLVLLLTVLPAYGLVWWLRHPGPPAYALGLGPKEREALGNLRAGRKESKGIRDAARAALRTVQQRAAEDLRLCDERLHALQRKRESVWQEAHEYGAQVGEPLWPLRLHEHALLILGGEVAGALPGQEPQPQVVEALALDGLHAALDSRSLHHVLCIRLTPAGGKEQTFRYQRTLESEVAADAFVVAVRGQIHEDQPFRDHLRAEDGRLAAEAKQAEADRTRVQDSGSNEIAEAEKNLTAAIALARAVRGKAYDNWQQDAGRRPFW